MPAISTMVYPAPAYVRVETSWGDQPQATGAAVYRVDCLTGERVPLRPYVSFNGDYLDLSCGYAVFWDTEPQLDGCVYYCTQAINPDGSVATQPAAALYRDTFTRTVVDGWGTSDDGHTYQLLGGTVPNDYDVTANKGTHTLTTNGVPRESIVQGLSVPDGQLYGFYQHPVVPTGASHEMDVRVRRVDSNNYCDMRLFFSTANTIQAAVRQVVAGVESFVVFSAVLTNAGGANLATTDPLSYVIEYWGSVMRAKVWKATDPEPITYSATTAVTFLSAGAVSYISFTGGGSTNVLPITTQFDSHVLLDPCATDVPIEACSPSLVVPSSGNFRLGDPVRPCNDVTLLLQAQIDPDCVPTQGIFFGNMADEDAAANSNTFLPVNAKYGIWINRTRGALASTLTVASKTFADRDALRQLNEPNSLLYLRGPAQYGINDRYMGVGNVNEARPVSDHRVQPRVVSMPHLEFERPSGPSTGVCGTRVEDLCDIYSSWDAVVAAGLTYVDLLRGAASNATPLPASTERDWAEVLADDVTWTGTNGNNTDWGDVLDGDA